MREQVEQDLKVFTDLGLPPSMASGFGAGVIAVVEYIEKATGMQMDARALFHEVAPPAAARIRAKLDAANAGRTSGKGGAS